MPSLLKFVAIFFLLCESDCHSLKSKPAANIDEVCGKQLLAKGFAYNEDPSESSVEKGEFPWTAVLMKNSSKYVDKRRYLCGGTLINSYTVVTAAHCIKKKGAASSLKAADVKVLLGAYNISIPDEQYRQEHEISRIVLHSGWNSDDHLNYAHDIALLMLKNEIKEFTLMIRPICLGRTTGTSQSKEGIVAGYGQFNETTATSVIPLKVKLPIVEIGDAIIKQKEISGVYWKESFAVGSETAGVCPGDSGSGFSVNISGTFYLRGIVSAAIQEFGYNCTHKNYAIMTDVEKYLEDFIWPASADPIKMRREFNIICGIANKNKGSSLNESDELFPHKFPWIVAIVRLETNGEFQYVCGGTLISSDTVVTAANCLTGGEHRDHLPIDDFRVVLGAHKFSKTLKDNEGLLVKIAMIVIHPDWISGESPSFAGDIAIVNIVDEESRMFPHSNIRPICLPFGDEIDEKISNQKNGIYASIYVSENESVTSSVVPRPRQKNISIVESSECFSGFNDIVKYSWSESICAEKLSDLRSNEAGLGYFMDINDKYYLRGIISSEVQNEKQESMLLMSDVIKYKEFLKKGIHIKRTPLFEIVTLMQELLRSLHNKIREARTSGKINT